VLQHAAQCGLSSAYSEPFITRLVAHKTKKANHPNFPTLRDTDNHTQPIDLHPNFRSQCYAFSALYSSPQLQNVVFDLLLSYIPSDFQKG
jgi:hypothetical protein